MTDYSKFAAPLEQLKTELAKLRNNASSADFSNIEGDFESALNDSELLPANIEIPNINGKNTHYSDNFIHALHQVVTLLHDASVSSFGAILYLGKEKSLLEGIGSYLEASKFIVVDKKMRDVAQLLLSLTDNIIAVNETVALHFLSKVEAKEAIVEAKKAIDNSNLNGIDYKGSFIYDGDKLYRLKSDKGWKNGFGYSIYIEQKANGSLKTQLDDLRKNNKTELSSEKVIDLVRLGAPSSDDKCFDELPCIERDVNAFRLKSEKRDIVHDLKQFKSTLEEQIKIYDAHATNRDTAIKTLQLVQERKKIFTDEYSSLVHMLDNIMPGTLPVYIENKIKEFTTFDAYWKLKNRELFADTDQYVTSSYLNCLAEDPNNEERIRSEWNNLFKYSRGCGLISISSDQLLRDKKKLAALTKSETCYLLYNSEVYLVDNKLKIKKLELSATEVDLLIFPENKDEKQSATKEQLETITSLTGHTYNRPELKSIHAELQGMTVSDVETFWQTKENYKKKVCEMVGNNDSVPGTLNVSADLNETPESIVSPTIEPNDQQDTSLNVNISPLALAIAELNKAKEEYHEVNNELNRINEEILLLRKQQDETFSAADRALLSSKKQQLNEMIEERGQFFAIGCSLKEQFANLQKEQVDLNNKKASGYELLTYLGQVVELIGKNPVSFLVNKEKFEQMKEYFESSEQQQFGVIDDLIGIGKERRVFQTNMGVKNLLPTLRTKFFDKLSGISRRLINVQSNVNKLNSKLRAEYNNNQEMQLEEYNTKIVNLELECKPLQGKNDEYEHLQQQLETLGLSREDISTRLVEKLEVFSEYKQKVSDIETEEQERNESIKEFLTVLKKLVHEIDEDESFDEDKRKKLLGQIAHKISYYQHHKNLFENRFYDTEDVSSKLDEISSTLVKLGTDFRTNFKKSTSAPSYSIFGNKRKAKAQEIEDLITRVNQLLNYTGDPLDSRLIVTYEKQLKELSQYDSIPRYKDSINKAKLDIEVRVHQIKYFGTEGEFEKYANGIRGCASALLGMIYTCLATVFFPCFDYKTDIMFLDDLKSTKKQKNIDPKIRERVANYPDSALSKILKEYQTGLEQLTQEAEALNTPQADHGATL